MRSRYIRNATIVAVMRIWWRTDVGFKAVLGFRFAVCAGTARDGSTNTNRHGAHALQAPTRNLAIHVTKTATAVGNCNRERSGESVLLLHLRGESAPLALCKLA